MAIHFERKSLFRESILEMIYVAEYCVNQKKNDPNVWGSFATGGILGFPSAIILFSIIDSIGSMFRGNSEFKIYIDGKETTIRQTNQHIYILNSQYFEQNLTQKDLDNIYKNVRSPLTHNSLLPEGYILDIGAPNQKPIQIVKDRSDNLYYVINLLPLFLQTQKAVNGFLHDLDSGQIDFENSVINQELKNRDSKAKLDLFKEYGISREPIKKPGE